MSLHYGYLLLTCRMGDPQRQPLSVSRFRELTKRMQSIMPQESDRELVLEDLLEIGCSQEESRQILTLLSQEALAKKYLSDAQKVGCGCLTWRSGEYPLEVMKKLHAEAPATVWYKGSLDLLNKPRISLVGSRDLMEDNREFAATVGRVAAQKGCVLVSGNARGADLAAQEACLHEGGQVISVVADSLSTKKSENNILWLSEDGYDERFSAGRALSRNRIVHCLSPVTFVAQAATKGGTWDGTCKNLRHGWSKVYCYDDGTFGSRNLQKLGAVAVTQDSKEAVIKDIIQSITFTGGSL